MTMKIVQNGAVRAVAQRVVVGGRNPMAGTRRAVTRAFSLQSDPKQPLTAESDTMGVNSHRRNVHTSLKEVSYDSFFPPHLSTTIGDSMNELDARHFGYRMVTPCAGHRYTATMTSMAAAEDDFFFSPDDHVPEMDDDVDSAASTHAEVSSFRTFMHDIELNSNAEDVKAAHAEWDTLMREECATKPPHFEYLKEDPYLSEFEDHEDDYWHVNKCSTTMDEHDHTGAAARAV